MLATAPPVPGPGARRIRAGPHRLVTFRGEGRVRQRRSEFDVTNTVQVSDPQAVHAAVVGIMRGCFPGRGFERLATAYADVVRLFRGEYPGYRGCETWYHDLQHTLDMTLALARLIDGHERSEPEDQRIGVERAEVALITGLFHDSGYMRRERDTRHVHGAEYTRTHVTRSGKFLGDYLPGVGFGQHAAMVAQLVHFTGYEIAFDKIQVEDPLWRRAGHLIGTADLIAQMADRCYLEKCRDRLYKEFLLGGVARSSAPDGTAVVTYASPRDLLLKTPGFCTKTRRDRLDAAFGSVYRYAAVHFGGINHYIESIDGSLAHLSRVIASDDWNLLRRRPPCFTAEALRGLPAHAPALPPTAYEVYC